MSSLSHLSSSPSKGRTRNAGISLSYETLKILDELRGDVPKSTFTLRLIERAYIESQQQQQQQQQQEECITK
jgi:hypothetical protein